MSRRFNLPQSRKYFIPAKDFREVHEWIHRAIVEIVTRFNGDGIEASDMHAALMCHAPPPGWLMLDAQKRSSQFWRALGRLVKKKVIEEYHSGALGHERSRARLRLANVLDRLTHALGD
jgi:hypothetical protein